MREQIEAAVKVLKEGGVILYPTDTIWGIGCDATNAEAVEKVFKIKNRADSKSLIVLAENLDMVARFVKEVPEIAINLVEVNDKPMTIIYPNAEQLAANVVAEDGSVGMRIPDHEFCRNLLRRFRRPSVSTSANISGKPSPKNLSEVSQEILDAVDLVVDQRFEEGSTEKASSIIKVGMDGEFQIIRA